MFAWLFGFITHDKGGENGVAGRPAKELVVLAMLPLIVICLSGASNLYVIAVIELGRTRDEMDVP
jgi:hypothetical protein